MIIKKNRNNSVEPLLKSIADSYGADLVIVRNDGCDVLFMNSAASKRIGPEQLSSISCRNGYMHLFPDLCANCRHKADHKGEPSSFDDIKDRNGRVFSVLRNNIEWVDGKPAIAYIVRDVDEERSAKSKMYNLAYYDQLAGIPTDKS